jgi:glycosyltransferase involved in cell wall biosynthesis
MRNVPTVSVVLIFFNDERFLEEAIRSVLDQSYTDWELLLVDDGSDDTSTEIGRRYASRQPDRIHYLEHPGHANRGPSAARNLGVRTARGAYVAFLDSDDVWLPEKLETQVGLLDAHPEAGLLVGASLYWWSWGGPAAQREDRVVHVGAAGDQVHHPPDLLHRLYPLSPQKGSAPCPSSWLARRDMVHRIGGFEEQFRTMYEDQAFLLKAYLHTPVYVSSRCLDRYRRHPDAVTMSTSRAGYLAARREVLEWFDRYLEEQAGVDPGVRRLVHRAMWPYRHPHVARARQGFGKAKARIQQRMARMRGVH